MGVLISLFFFMIWVFAFFGLVMAFQWIGLIIGTFWIAIVLGREEIRIRFLQGKPLGYTTTEKRRRELIEAEKERRKTRRVAT